MTGFLLSHADLLADLQHTALEFERMAARYRQENDLSRAQAAQRVAVRSAQAAADLADALRACDAGRPPKAVVKLATGLPAHSLAPQRRALG